MAPVHKAGDAGAGVVSQLRKGVAPYCVLALLARERRYGYDLARELGEVGVVASAGSVYPLLGRLQEAGWIEPSWRPMAEGVPRKYYALTADGRVALRGFQGLWPSFVQRISRLLAVPPDAEHGDDRAR